MKCGLDCDDIGTSQNQGHPLCGKSVLSGRVMRVVGDFTLTAKATRKVSLAQCRYN